MKARNFFKEQLSSEDLKSPEEMDKSKQQVSELLTEIQTTLSSTSTKDDSENESNAKTSTFGMLRKESL